MNKLGWLMMASFCWMGAASAAGFDCDKARSKVEKLICDDVTVGPLDEILTAVYARVREIAPDQRALISQQRAWIERVRDVCSDSNCLYRVYTQRILEMNEAQVVLTPISDAPLSDAEARDVCSEMAALANNRQLEKRVLRSMNPHWVKDSALESRYVVSQSEMQTLLKNGPWSYSDVGEIVWLRLKQRDDPVRFSISATGGTCPTDQMFSLSRLLVEPDDRRGIEEVNDPGDKIRWAYWGGADYPIIHRNRNFVITAGWGDPDAIRMVSWIKPDGKIRPLCLMERSEPSRTLTTATDRKLCGRLIGTPRPESPADISGRVDLPTNRDDFEQRYGRYGAGMKAYRLDINSDGVMENVGYFSYSSGAGCGSEDTWLSVLSPDLTRKIPSPLQSVLDELNSVEGVYTVQKQSYIEGARQGDGLGIFRIRQARMEPVCRYRLDYRYHIGDFFSVTE